MRPNRLFRHALCVLAALPAYAIAAEPIQHLDCAVTFGHGIVRSQTDLFLKKNWDTLNGGFHRFVSEELAGKGVKVFPVFVPIESVNKDVNRDILLKESARARCHKIVATSVFNETMGEKVELVFSIAAHPVIVTRHPGGTRYAIGPRQYTKEYRYPSPSEELDKIVISELGAKAAAELLATLEQK